MGSFDVFTDISEHVTLVKLIYSIGGVNHDIIFVWYWIFDSSYEKSLVLNRKSLDIICALSVGQKQVAKFERVFCAVRCT